MSKLIVRTGLSVLYAVPGMEALAEYLGKIMLPSKIILDKLKEQPKSANIDFWDRWYDGKQTVFDIDAAALNLIKQSRG